jgi:hypothetical protein
MKWPYLFLAALFVGCFGTLQGQPAATTTFTYRSGGEVRSINLLLLIADVEQQSDGLLKLKVQTSIEGKVVVFNIFIPAHWDEDPQNSAIRRSIVVFITTDDSSAVLDDLLRQYYGKVPSVFTHAGFRVFTKDTVEQIELHTLEFGGFANEDLMKDESGSLQCLAFVDFPNKFLKLAFLVEGYGGSPPNDVYAWLRKNG